MIVNLLKLTFFVLACTSATSVARKISDKQDEGIDFPDGQRNSPRGSSLVLLGPGYQLSQEAEKVSVRENLKEVFCGLHSEVVQLATRTTAVLNRPQFVSVKRCKGACDKPLVAERCFAVTSRKVRVAVWSEGEDQPQSVEVEEHLSCHCGCVLKKEACLAVQVYSAEKCQCQCIKQASECAQEQGEQFNATTCTCVKRQGKRRDETDQ